MKLVHLETQVQTIFGVLDGDDIISKHPLSVQLQKLDKAQFEAAYNFMLENKQKLTQQVEAGQQPETKVETKVEVEDN